MQQASPNGLPVVKVTRPGKWRNPFKVEKPGGRYDERTPEQAVNLFGHYITNKLKKEPHYLESLRGKNLACWCPIWSDEGLRVPCHADILLELANQRIEGAK